MNEILLELFGGKVICTDKKLGTWYMYDGKQWKETYTNYVIDQLCNLFTDDDEISAYCMNIVSEPEFLSDVFAQCTELFYDSKFPTELNRNINLICFENGTYHILEKELRPHSYKDRISFSTHTVFNRRSHYTDDIDDALQKIIPDTKLRDKFIMDLTSCFYRSGFDEKDVYHLTGYTESFIQVIKESFGDYFSEYSAENLADFVGKRIILLRNPTQELITKVTTECNKALLLVDSDKIQNSIKLELCDVTEPVMKYLLQMIIV